MTELRLWYSSLEREWSHWVDAGNAAMTRLYYISPAKSRIHRHLLTIQIRTAHSKIQPCTASEEAPLYYSIVIMQVPNMSRCTDHAKDTSRRSQWADWAHGTHRICIPWSTEKKKKRKLPNLERHLLLRFLTRKKKPGFYQKQQSKDCLLDGGFRTTIIVYGVLYCACSAVEQSKMRCRFSMPVGMKRFDDTYSTVQYRRVITGCRRGWDGMEWYGTVLTRTSQSNPASQTMGKIWPMRRRKGERGSKKKIMIAVVGVCVWLYSVLPRSYLSSNRRFC